MYPFSFSSPGSWFFRTVGALVLVGMLVGTCLPSSEDGQAWLLFIELVFEQGKRTKTKRLLFFKGGKDNATCFTFARWILRVLLIGMVLLARVKSILLLARAGTQAASCCTHPTHGSQGPWLCPCMQHFLQNDPLVRRYQPLFAGFDFSFLPSLPASWIPLQAFLKAYIVMVDQGIQTFTRLRTFLLEHPAVTWFIGFRPNSGDLPPCPPTLRWEHLVPSDRYLREKIQWMDHLFFKTLLAQTIQKIKTLELLDGKVACDVKEIWASVKQNNPKQFVKDRWNKDVIPTGNPDARLGAKPSSNKDPKGKPLPRLFWGFKSALFAATTHHGLVILAETTLQANTGDVSCFTPLLKEFLTYGLKATIFLADAAFDAWYVYRDIANQGGKTYIPLNSRGHDVLEHAYSKNGKLLCRAGREMKSGGTWFDKQKGYHRKKWLCPLKPHAQTCPHAAGKPNGCTRTINLDDHHRFQLDRSSHHFKHTYKTRTVSERAFSTFQRYGREITYQRNLNTGSHLNTLTYAVMNAHVILKATAVPEPT